MKTKITKLLLSAALLMCCTVMANAQLGKREGSLVKDNTGNMGGFHYALYKDYSYTYAYGNNVITKSFSGNCAVVIGGDIRFSNIASSVTYNGEEYTVVALGSEAYLNAFHELRVPNSVEVIECSSFTHTQNPNYLGSLTFADGDKDLWCFPVVDGSLVSRGTFSKVNTLKKINLGRNLHYPGEGDNTKGSWAPFAQGSFSDLEVTVGQNVTRIPDFCFHQSYNGITSNTNGVKTLNLTNATSLQSMGNYAFFNNRMLTAPDFTKATSLQSIGDAAFMNCASLTKVNFGVTPPSYIGRYAFAGCTNLSKVFFFSNTPPTLAEGCFSENTTVYVKNSRLVEEYKNKSAFTGNIIAYPDNMMLKYQTTDGNALNRGGCLYSSYETGYGTMYFDHVLTSIGNSWFNHCGSLFSISLPNTITSIETLAFQDCTNLRTIVIPEKVNHIGDYAFGFCGSLREVFFLGNSNITLDNYIFGHTGKMNQIVYVSDMKNFSDQWCGRPVRSWRSGKGDGTREHPYEIENYINLYGFSLDVMKGNTTICGKLTADITVNGNVLNEDGTLRPGLFKPWIPIGDWGRGSGYNGFAGEFNGNGHTISGLYFNDETRSAVGLFGMTNNSGNVMANIHDVGVKDSYFRGMSHVAGICGDLASGKIQNCWNAATVQATNGTVGGLAGSCYYAAYITGCYNIGYVSVESDNKNSCGGICGVAFRNNGTDGGSGGWALQYCASLEGKCDRAWNSMDNGQANNVTVKNAVAFASGEVCYILNGMEIKDDIRIGTKWRQQIGKDPLPMWTGNYLVNYYPFDPHFYYNETVCEVTDNHAHDFYDYYVNRCDGSYFNYWCCRKCGKYYAYEGRGGVENMTQEFPGEKYMTHFLKFVKAAVMPTTTTTGHYDYWHCTHCQNNFLEGNYSEPVTTEQLTVSTVKNNEIWYTSTQKQKIDPYKDDVFGATIQKNEYEYGLGKITFDKDVTSIGEEAFNAAPYDSWFNGCVDLQSISIPSSVTSIGQKAFRHCRSLQSVSIPSGVTSIGGFVFADCGSLQSINIPSSVTSIGEHAFSYCNSLVTVTFNSLPVLSTEAFWPCNKLVNKVLDLTDSEKPYIGNSLNAYHPFTEARYHRTLEKGKLETIVLPFVPTAESTVGLNFYTLTSISKAKTIFTKVEDIHAGEPYLVKNISETKEFTFIATNPKSITIKSSDQCADGFTMRAAFQKATLTNDANKKFYYFNGETFLSITENQEIDPFRAYIETSNTSAPESLIVETIGGDTSMEGNGTKDNPYQIRNKADLDWFVDEVNSIRPNICAKLIADIKYNGEMQLLDADGNINSGSFDSWRPIGNETNGYSGEFNGNGHTISGLYVNDENKEKIGLFGRAISGAHIYNLGVNDSYFRGKSWVSGICGELNEGRIENCWNAATIIAQSATADFGYAGGIAATCETNASVISCYNIGKVTSAIFLQSGGICGMINFNSTIKDCVTLDVCDAGCKDIREQANIINMFTKNIDAFKNGEVCWLLNGGSSENVKWHQMLGEGGDKYPTLTGENVVYPTVKKCDGSAKTFSNTKPESVSLDDHVLTSHDSSVSTCSVHGKIQHRSCTICGHLFKYESNEELTEEQVLLPLDPDNHSLSLTEGKVHCEWCMQDFEHYFAIDNNPVLLKAENDSYSLDKVELKYGHSYLCSDEVNVGNFSYTFSYYPNQWNSWFVPFEITTSEVGDKNFTAAYIAGVRQYEKDAEGNTTTQVDVVKIKNGTLRAGTPYLIKQESSATEASTTDFHKTGAMLKKSSDVHPGHTETMTAKYDFIGTYNTIPESEAAHNYYIMGSKGTLVHTASTVPAMDWYMKITDKGGVYDEPASSAKTIIINVIGEEDETTGIVNYYSGANRSDSDSHNAVYNLRGQKLNAPKKGQINIINGRKVLVR